MNPSTAQPDSVTAETVHPEAAHLKPVNPVEREVLAAIAARSSPRAFAPRPLGREKLLKVLEAARWAASSNNEQPWRFVVASREDPEAFGTLLECLKESNRVWAQHASALLLVVARTTFERSGGPNKYAWHDTGQAVAHLALRATALGLALHQMGGIYPERAAEVYGVLEPHVVVSAAALGYPGDPANLPEDLRDKEARPRTRKPLSEFVFSGRFGEPAEL